MLDVVEDGQGLPPCVAGRLAVTCGVVGVAEVAEHLGFAEAVAEFAGEVECVPVAGDGLVVLAKAVVGVAEGVPGGGLTVVVVKFVEHCEGVLAVADGLAVVSLVAAVPAD